ncbi:hypothetical protein [Actinoplanes sp. GCM10030250]|uniref:hypothetical protein n=1 Tax=Actinoplanes sp. GCM10030250 TaxID=3273376 RepID=UPI00360AD95E
MLRTRWIPGPAVTGGPVLISVTDFRADRRRDLPRIYQAGLQLRRDWPLLEGAVGMWLWTAPGQGRCGSVSVWSGETAMYQFVARPDHVRIMRRYRDRGNVRATTWTDPQPDRDAIWSRARLYLSGVEIQQG